MHGSLVFGWFVGFDFGSFMAVYLLLLPRITLNALRPINFSPNNITFCFIATFLVCLLFYARDSGCPSFNDRECGLPIRCLNTLDKRKSSAFSHPTHIYNYNLFDIWLVEIFCWPSLENYIEIYMNSGVRDRSTSRVREYES